MPTTPIIPAGPIPLRSEIKAELRDFKAKHELGPMMSELYRKAEARLRKQKRQRKLKAAKPKAGGAKEKMDRADNRRLLHELQVHQVELEMQNSELQENRNRMEGMLEKYTDLYDFAPVGYFTLAASGTVQFVNLTGASLVGMERSKLVGQPFGRLFAAEQRAAFNSFLKQVFASPAKQSADFELARPGKPSKGVNLEAQRLLGGQECRVMMIDITGRKQAENEVRVSEIRYRRLFEAAHDGVLLIDAATRKITDANPFMTKLLGYPHDQLVGKELFEIGLLKDEAASREIFKKLKIEHEIRYENLPLASQDGRHQEVEVVANLYQENGHAVIQCNIRDITERKHTEQELAEKARLLDLSHDAIIVRDMKGRIRYWNHGAEEIYGWSRAEALGKVSNVLLQTKYPVPLKQMTAELFRTDRWIGELLHRKRDGRRITVLARKTLDRDDQGRPVAVLENITDITGRKQAEDAQRRLDVMTASNAKLKLEIVRRQAVEESLMRSEQHQRHLLGQSRLLQEQLRQVSRQVLRAQEEERKRISRELHDVIAQTLTGINVRLSALKKEAGLNTKGFGRKIARTQRLVEKSVNIVHQFARELRPAVLDDLGLIPALHSFVKMFSQRTRLHVHLKVFADVEKMDANRRTILYRVVQEALTNVARHARAGEVEVSLQELPGHVCLKIRDNGRSFSVKRVLHAKGGKRLGLLGMRERLEMVGGTFAVESAPGQGTTVIAQIPLGQATPEQLAETKI
jgi:PAS domain S-box-containing protein